MSATAEDPAIAWAMGGGQGDPASVPVTPTGASDDPAISFAASGGENVPDEELATIHPRAQRAVPNPMPILGNDSPQNRGLNLDPSQMEAQRRAVTPTSLDPIVNQAVGFVTGLPKKGGDMLQAYARSHNVENPYLQAAIGELPQLGANIGTSLIPMGAAGKVEEGAELLATGRSAGAAASRPDISQASPELQDAIRQATQKGGGIVNQDALARHMEADSLPVPVRLTRGQATQDPEQLSLEQNRRGQINDLSTRFNEQNGRLVQNLQEFRDRVGPDVFTTNPVEHGDTLIEAYKDKAAAADADISAKYQALKDANGGQWPVDVTTLKANVESALHEKLLYEHAPSAEMSQLQRAVNSGKMSFEQFEAMRTNLARIMRSSSDGNERAAAGVIRDQMEQLPMSGQAANLKDLADSARSAARVQFQALDADPAYKAAVNDTVTPDRFVSRFVVNGSRDDVATMKANFGDNPQAQQTMSVAALDHLRKAAGIDSGGMGNFAQATFNRNLEALGPKMGSLFDPQTADELQTLGNVARYTQFQPRGSFVNNSNTATSAMAEFGKSTLEHYANVKAGGFPVGTWTRKALQGRDAKAFARDALAPGAGLTDVEAP